MVSFSEFIKKKFSLMMEEKYPDGKVTPEVVDREYEAFLKTAPGVYGAEYEAFIEAHSS